MDGFVNRLKEIVSLDMIIYVLIALLVIIILSLVIRSLRVKRVKKELDSLELKYSELKSVPLSFKLNKATALAKVNHSISDQVNEYQNRFDLVQEKLKEFSVVLAELDDFVYSKKVKKANDKIEILKPIAASCEEEIYAVDALFDEVLEQENLQRANINMLKNEFRNLKRQLMENRGLYRQSVEYLDDYIVQVENMFSIFEEWMFASEFNKASDKQNEIKSSLEVLSNYLNELPAIYDHACIKIPHKEEEIAGLYANAFNQGVYLEHLEVKKNIEVISDMVADILLKLQEGNMDHVERVLEDCDTRLEQLTAQIEKENQAFDVIRANVNDLFSAIKKLNGEVQSIKDTYSRVQERFGFENLSGNLLELEDNLDSLNEMRFKLENILTQGSVPFSTLLVTYEKVENECKAIEKETLSIKTKLDNATSDEERAKKQLIKLQLITNEMCIKIAKRRLPSVDDKFESDIRNANVYIVEIKELLERVPLDVIALNKKLQEAIDYIYTLYNSVNNLVGMASMVENAILFGNKYRSDYPEIDSELTRAELCFTNGQYTKALKIAISVIEKLHPGAYEKLISNEETEELAHA